jgi:hypothetical protein
VSLRSALVILFMAALTFTSVAAAIVLSILVGRERAMYRVEYGLAKLLEWLPGEGQHRKARGDEERA